MPIKSKSDIRIVFMGTPDFAVATLQRLVQNQLKVVAVITAPDRPAGRGRKMQQSAVKKHALLNELPVLQPTNLKDNPFVEELKAYEANLFIVVAFRMLPKIIWQMPKYGTFNLHASLLPQYRGAAPINWAIINGETETGVTTFFIDEKIDTGKIILQESTHISADEDAGQLHDRLMELGAKLVVKTVQQIAKENITTTIQPVNTKLKAAPKIYKETCKVDWSDNLQNIHNLVRGLSPYPTAWTTLVNDGEASQLKIFKATIETGRHTLNTGEIVSTKNSLKIAADGGYIVLEKIQIQGKKAMPVVDALNGLRLSKDAYVR